MKYEIKIPNPCSENWNQMTPTEKGVFCFNCQKEVLDFTKVSNYELSMRLDNNQNICGKFRVDQINTEINSLKKNQVHRVGLLLGLTSLLTITTPVFGQSNSVQIEKTSPVIKIDNQKNNHNPKDSIQINGVVLVTSGALPGVNIFIKGHSYKTQTDFDGNFSISISQKDFKKKLTLIFSFIGFESKEVEISNDIKFIEINMTEDKCVMGEVVIIKKQNIFRRIGNLFRKN
ncbi:carboxypeptidase-like regulatory domain-containing protein [Maribacter antarcticus]|uniref:carboxypeptidase-like regulatory domain-containing protein n=1 Tax=Maribacter antarcticus TaxID=505250 RepID=UPI00047D3F60|nr:carboxypeptidase-like regulatory domain-containing protein [Maribacter antarcticus]